MKKVLILLIGIVFLFGLVSIANAVEVSYILNGENVTKEDSFENAIYTINCSENGGIIILLEDIQLSQEICIEKELALLSDGVHTISLDSISHENPYCTFEVYAPITIGKEMDDQNYIIFENISFSLIGETAFQYEDGLEVTNYDSKLVINNGVFQNNKHGLIDVYGGEIVINNGTFNNNIAEKGGVIFCNDANITINGGTFTNNSAIEEGGVIYNENSTVIINKGQFVENSAFDGGVISINNVTIIKDDGYGTYEDYEGEVGSVIINGGEFTKNIAEKKGGVIYNLNGKVIVNQGEFVENSANEGGVIAEYVYAGRLKNEIIINSGNFINNFANKKGGAIESISLTLNGGKFTNNSTVGIGGGIHIYDLGGSEYLRFGGNPKIYNNTNGNLYIETSRHKKHKYNYSSIDKVVDVVGNLGEDAYIEFTIEDVGNFLETLFISSNEYIKEKDLNSKILIDNKNYCFEYIENGNVKIINKPIKVYIDGKELKVDVKPQIINGRVMLPLRAVFEAINAEVKYDVETREITALKEGRIVKFKIDNEIMNVDGKKIKIDVPPMLIENRTLVPVRACAESFDMKVEYEENTKTVIIKSEGEINSVEKDDEIIEEIRDAFSGNWERTNVNMGQSASLEIMDVSKDGFKFRLEAVNGANVGEMEGTAVFMDEKLARYDIPKDEFSEGVVVTFNLDKENIVVLSEGDYFALGLGAGVDVDGTYTKGKVNYLNEGIEDRVLGENKERLKDLVGEEVYNSIIGVLKYGTEFDEKSLTYSGFLRGIGQGVDLLIEGNNMYVLYNSIGEYTFYTNDKNYKDNLEVFNKYVEEFFIEKSNIIVKD